MSTIKESKTLQIYRPSASVIIALKCQKLEAEDYNVLLFRRTPQTAFAPNHCVFPGGALDNSDESIAWLHYFKECGISLQKLEELVIVDNNRPEFLKSQGTGCYDRFFKKEKLWARDISLRITALRETFEEVGILLCRSIKNVNQTNNGTGHFLEDFDRIKWQQLVHEDGKKFLELCRYLNVVPDLWCLQEWSAWRTPATASRKFDTVYYFVALEQTPSLLPESSEVELIMWHTPQEFFDKYLYENTIWLPFIIFYELARILNFRLWQNLFQFSRERSRKNSTLLMAAFYRCTDGIVGVLPADDAYPSDPNSQTNTVPVDLTVIQFGNKAKNVHRVVQRHVYNLTIEVNIPPFDGHLLPQTVTTLNKL